MKADILSHFAELEDPRVERTKRYPLMEIIFLIISATLSGCEGWKSIRDFGLLKIDWLKEYLPYYNTERLHMGINFKTPLEMLQSDSKVLIS